MEIFLLWIFFSFIVGAVGSSRKIGFWGSFLLSLLLSPLIGLIFALVSKSLEDEAFQKKLLDTKQPTLILEQELKRLDMLKRAGMLTDEEYDAQRKKVLSA